MQLLESLESVCTASLDHHQMIVAIAQKEVCVIHLLKVLYRNQTILSPTVTQACTVCQLQEEVMGSVFLLGDVHDILRRPNLV